MIRSAELCALTTNTTGVSTRESEKSEYKGPVVGYDHDANNQERPADNSDPQYGEHSCDRAEANIPLPPLQEWDTTNRMVPRRYIVLLEGTTTIINI
jgi:hypothetical protein